MKLYRPDGSLYAQRQSSTSPLTITVPVSNSVVGSWRYEVSGVDVPSNKYPFVVGIGASPPHLPNHVFTPVVFRNAR